MKITTDGRHYTISHRSQSIRVTEKDALKMVDQLIDNGLILGSIAAKALGKSKPSDVQSRGGKIGGHARAAKLTSEERSEIARKASHARWGK